MIWRIWTVLGLLLFAGAAAAQPAGEPVSIDLSGGSATLNLDFSSGEYELVLYSTATGEPDTARTFSYTLSGPAVAARPVPLRRRQTAAPSDRDRFESVLRREERELARRLRQTGGWRPSLSKLAREEQATRSFTFSQFGGVTSDRTVQATLAASSARALGYLDNNLAGAEVTITTTDIQAMLDRFSSNSYPILTSNFGEPSDVDGNGKVIFLFSPLVDQVGGVAGFYSSRSLFSTSRGGNGNEADMMFIGLSHDLDFYEPLLAHEFQHLINFNQHVLVHNGESEESWLNEALSHYTEDLVNGHITGDLPRLYGPFLEAPDAHSLIGDASLNSGIRGAAYLFLRGLVEEFGTTIAPSLVKTPLAGISNVEAETGRNFNDLYRTYAARLFLSGNGLNTAPAYNYTYAYFTEPITGARSIPPPAETGFSSGGPSLSGRVKPLAPVYLRLMGNGANSALTLQTESAGRFHAFLIPIPPDFHPHTALARDYFPRLTFDNPLEGRFTAGSALDISGAVSDPSVAQILFRFEPLGGQDTLRFFADVQNGRFSRSILFDPSQAGDYALVLFMGEQDQSLPFIGRFSPVTVTEGGGQVLIPENFFSGLTLDAPLAAYHTAGQGASLSGRVTDASIEVLLMVLTPANGGEEIRIQTDVTGGAFRKGFVFFPEQAGTYTLDVYGGSSGGSLPHQGSYSPFVITSSGSERVFLPVDALNGILLDEPIPASYVADHSVSLSGTVTDPSVTQILFRFDPLGTGEQIRFFTDVSGSRFEQTFEFTGEQAGTYELVLFGGQAGQSLPHLDTFSPVSILAAPAANPADFNNDGQVNFTDFLIFASAFGASEGDPAYNASFDLDPDGSIRFSDFVVFVRLYGQ